MRGSRFGRAIGATVTPTLTTFFDDLSVTPAHFLSAVRAAKVSEFSKTDAARASKLVLGRMHDPRRLLSLAAQDRLPVAVTTWIWPEIHSVLRSTLPEIYEDAGDDRSRLLVKLNQALLPAIKSRNAVSSQRATTLLLLGLTWVMKEGHVDALQALDVVKDSFGGHDLHAKSVIRTTLSTGRRSDILRLTAIYKLVKGNDA